MNAQVVDIHIAAGIPAVGISSYPSVVLDNKVILNQPGGVLDSILNIAKHGMVPVIHGDAVMDTRLECTILSGDSIMIW